MRDGKKLVLCVDDDPDVLDYLRLTLEAGGYAVVTAESAEDGANRYQSERPDAVIVDLMMEEVDAGTALCTRLKALGNVAPIYMLSSVGDDLNRMTNTAELGLTGVFQKPLDKNTLLKVLKEKLK